MQSSIIDDFLSLSTGLAVRGSITVHAETKRLYMEATSHFQGTSALGRPQQRQQIATMIVPPPETTLRRTPVSERTGQWNVKPSVLTADHSTSSSCLGLTVYAGQGWHALPEVSCITSQMPRVDNLLPSQRFAAMPRTSPALPPATVRLPRTRTKFLADSPASEVTGYFTPQLLAAQQQRTAGPLYPQTPSLRSGSDTSAVHPASRPTSPHTTRDPHRTVAAHRSASARGARTPDAPHASHLPPQNKERESDMSARRHGGQRHACSVSHPSHQPHSHQAPPYPDPTTPTLPPVLLLPVAQHQPPLSFPRLVRPPGPILR